MTSPVKTSLSFSRVESWFGHSTIMSLIYSIPLCNSANCQLPTQPSPLALSSLSTRRDSIMEDLSRQWSSFLSTSSADASPPHTDEAVIVNDDVQTFAMENSGSSTKFAYESESLKDDTVDREAFRITLQVDKVASTGSDDPNSHSEFPPHFPSVLSPPNGEGPLFSAEEVAARANSKAANLNESMPVRGYVSADGCQQSRSGNMQHDATASVEEQIASALDSAPGVLPPISVYRIVQSPGGTTRKIPVDPDGSIYLNPDAVHYCAIIHGQQHQVVDDDEAESQEVRDDTEDDGSGDTMNDAH